MTQKTISKYISKYMARIGKRGGIKGGKSTSDAKKRASAENLKAARGKASRETSKNAVAARHNPDS